MATITITQTISKIHTSKKQKRTLEALGLRHMHASVTVEATPQIMGMVGKVKHLVSTDTIK
jgi:large subunit ribosomal protein L30